MSAAAVCALFLLVFSRKILWLLYLMMYHASAFDTLRLTSRCPTIPGVIPALSRRN